MIMLLGVGGVAFYMMRKNADETSSIEETAPYQYQPGEAGNAGGGIGYGSNIYNVGYGGPSGGFIDLGYGYDYDYDRDWDRDRRRYDHWRSYGGSLVGVWFRDDDIKDFFKWLSKKRRRDDDIEDWIKKRMKKNRKNRRGDRGNKDRDDDDKEWWKRAVDWDKGGRGGRF